FTTPGFTLAHVIVGRVVRSVVLIWSALGYFRPRRHEPVSIAIVYWHFVDVVWLAVFSTFYISPYLMRWAMAKSPTQPAEHPAPHGGRAGLTAQLFGVAAGPGAWI